MHRRSYGKVMESPQKADSKLTFVFPSSCNRKCQTRNWLPKWKISSPMTNGTYSTFSFSPPSISLSSLDSCHCLQTKWRRSVERAVTRPLGKFMKSKLFRITSKIRLDGLRGYFQLNTRWINQFIFKNLKELSIASTWYFGTWGFCRRSLVWLSGVRK